MDRASFIGATKRSLMRVLIIAQYFPPDIGGGSTRASNVALGLRKLGCNVNVVTAFPHYPHGNIPKNYRRKALVVEHWDDIKLVRTWIPALPHNSVSNRLILHFCFIASSLFSLPVIGKVDVIFAANPNLFSFFSALIYSFVKRKPIVRNVDDLWPEVFYDFGLVKVAILRRLLDFIAKLSYMVPIAITPISPGYKQRIIEKYGIRKSKINVIEVGVDSAVLRPPKGEKNNGFVVMYSGILGAAYDFKTVLKAAKLLSDYGDIVFIIRGVGECEFEIRHMVRELKLANVVLDTSFVSKSKLVEILNSADAFLLPMKPIEASERGLPTKILEYQACGKPVICCSQGEPGTYIKSTRSGLVLRPCDPKALAEAILKLYRNKELASEMGRNGWKYVSQNLTYEKIGKRMHDVFQHATMQ